MIKDVIFDLWLTLGQKTHSIFSAIFKYLEVEPTQEHIHMLEEAVQNSQVKTAEDFARSICKKFNISYTDQFQSFVTKTIEVGIGDTYVYKGMIDLLTELKKDYKLGMLSNSDVYVKQTQIYKETELFFDQIVFSCETDVVKPDKKSFQIICDRLGVDFGEVLFIDDSAYNIDKAESYGIKSIHFVGVDDLKKKLLEILPQQ